jgi:hypothetical protein
MNNGYYNTLPHSFAQADKAGEGIGLDYEYVQALSDLRVDLSE